jgi:LPS export ABC transporter protein LptC
LLAFFLPASLHGITLVIDYGMIKGRFFRILSSILIVGILIILSYNDNNVKIRPSYQTSAMDNLHLTQTDDNKVHWELQAENAIFPIDKKEVILKSIGLTINNSPKIYLTSDSGIYEVDSGNVTLNEPVEVIMKDTKFSTDSLNWNSSDEIISTKDPVKFLGSNFLIEGIGLTAKVTHQKVKIQKNVKAIFYR